MPCLRRIIGLGAAVSLLCGTTTVSAEAPKLTPNLPDEPLAKELSLAKAAAFLDQTSLAWTQQRKCGTCHTNYPYLLARPLLGGDTAALTEVRRFFEHRIAHWDSGNKEDKPRWDTEVVATAATLALMDARTTGKLHPLTRQALDRMWTLQQPNGAWNWIKCNWPPMEHDDYFGAVYAALGVGHAPDGYAQTDKAKQGLEKLRRYFKINPPPSLHHKAMLLWASLKVDGLMTDRLREATIKELLALQRPDGGWSLPSLGDWTGYDERPNDKTAPSDGYATGLVIYVLRQAGVPAAHEPIQQGVAWLRANQRESGRWFTRSLNTDRYHFITHAATAYAVLALKACEAAGQ
ncbi:MAG TPA: prenyltransferase/squalene oxidase repeat-containing protein [Gemmataceae bacterium]|nr:prenyltransferase/squalene oxidase repeat-containing protein [Gemmataceae bacterium]